MPSNDASLGRFWRVGEGGDGRRTRRIFCDDQLPATVRSSRVSRARYTSPIGAGRMGEVYRARDTRLDRTVAGSWSSQKIRRVLLPSPPSPTRQNRPREASLLGMDHVEPDFC